MKKLSLNAVCFILAGIIACGTIAINALADSSYTVKSKGVFTYQQGDNTVIIDSADLVNLNNSLTELKAKLHIS